MVEGCSGGVPPSRAVVSQRNGEDAIAASKVQCSIHAYGIMPNHVHIIAEISDAALMARYVQAWKSTSSHRINLHLGRSGALWQKDYYSHIIRTSAEYENQMRYVAGNNLVRAWRLDG